MTPVRPSALLGRVTGRTAQSVASLQGLTLNGASRFQLGRSHHFVPGRMGTTPTALAGEPSMISDRGGRARTFPLIGTPVQSSRYAPSWKQTHARALWGRAWPNGEGDHSTGSIELTARADRYVQEGTIFIPFAYVEAAANVLTNPQVDPRVQILRARNVPRSSSVGT
jgi:hypothetical protein